MRFCFVSTSRGSPFMTELLSAVSAATASAGHTVDFAFDEFPPLHDGDVYVVIPHEFGAWGNPRGFPDPEQRARTIALCTENPGTEWFEATHQHVRQFAAAMSINRASAAELRGLGIPCEHLQLGYTPLWDSWLGDPAAERQIDVLYLGAADPRRDPLLGGCGRYLWRRECQFLVPPLEPRRRPRPDYLGGADKYARLRSARVLLNLHRTTSAALEWMRFLEAICNGCVVVSEPCLDSEPLVAGEHFVAASAERIALVVDRLLDDPEELARLRTGAYEFVREELPMGHAVDQLAALAAQLPLQPLDTRDPAPVSGAAPAQPAEPAGSPEPAGAPGKTAGATSIRARAPRRLLRDISHRVATARRPGVEIRAQTPAYAPATPRVSVVVTAHGREHDAVEALAGIAASLWRELEVLVLDEAPDGRSAAAVRRFLNDHPSLPAALLRRPASRGLADSRNALADSRNALAERARGEYVFILDADGGIYPSALERLVTALDTDRQAAFAYPMVAIFDGDRPVELLSSLPWEPERLKRGDRVDAMALIRRERLLELGGYATDPRLAGWEDFHLWCQCAEAGDHGVHVPQVLGWRRRTASSTPRSQTGAPATWALMQARFPRLLGVASAA
jgi:hypothetical protein